MWGNAAVVAIVFYGMHRSALLYVFGKYHGDAVDGMHFGYMISGCFLLYVVYGFGVYVLLFWCFLLHEVGNVLLSNEESFASIRTLEPEE